MSPPNLVRNIVQLAIKTFKRTGARQDVPIEDLECLKSLTRELTPRDINLDTYFSPPYIDRVSSLDSSLLTQGTCHKAETRLFYVRARTN